jgi:hypothetical protein
MKRWWALAMAAFGAAAMLAVLAGCEDSGGRKGTDVPDDDDTPAPTNGAPQSLTGGWNASGNGYDRVLQLTQTGSSISGDSIDGGDRTPVTGTVNGNVVTLYCEDVVGTGTINGNRMSGTFVYGGGDGRWEAVRRN